jgi:membrane protein DedA with SNARE-associated domain
MKPLLILVLLPVLMGVVSNTFFRHIRSAALAATIGAPIVVYLCFKALDPDGTWSWLAALLVAPLVISMALVTVLLWFGRSRARKRRSSWNST